MDKSFVGDMKQVIEEGIIREVDGKSFSPVKLQRVVDDRRAAPIQLNTLTGLVDFIKSGIDASMIAKPIVVVESHERVILVSALGTDTKLRDSFIDVSLVKDLQKFPYQSFIESEDFIIKIKSLFLPTPAQADLVSYVSRLSVQDSLCVEDDGVSQTATVKRGMSGALKNQETAPSIVTLKPYRTFREVEQPESSFLFRMRLAEGKVPTCALFESDGGVWRMSAINNIKQYLVEELPELTVIA